MVVVRHRGVVEDRGRVGVARVLDRDVFGRFGFVFSSCGKIWLVKLFPSRANLRPGEQKGEQEPDGWICDIDALQIAAGAHCCSTYRL